MELSFLAVAFKSTAGKQAIIAVEVIVNGGLFVCNVDSDVACLHNRVPSEALELGAAYSP